MSTTRFFRGRAANGGASVFAGYLFACLLWPLQLLAADDEPLAVIQEATHSVLDALNSSPGLREDPAALSSVVQKRIVPYIDFVTLSRLALGRNWLQATAEQRSQFSREFGRLLITTYSKALAGYAGQEIEFLSSSRSADNRRATVRTRIIEQGRAPLAVDYSLMRGNGGWRIYDVAIEGVSLAINYRTTFATEIRDHGMDGLIKHLIERNAPRFDNATAAPVAAVARFD